MQESAVEWSNLQQKLASSKRQADKFNTTTIVYDSTTGNYYYGMNRGITISGDEINPALTNLLPEKSLNQYRVGNCAEVDAVNQALNNGANISHLNLYTIDAKTGVPKAMCENCVYTFDGYVKSILSE